MDKYFNQLDKAIDRMVSGKEKELLKVYKKSLKELRGKISEQYSKYAIGEQLTFAEMSKYGRNERLFREIQGEINNLYRTAGVETRRLASNAYEESYYRTAFALEKGTQAKLSYTQIPREQIKAAVQMPLSGLTLNDRLSRNRQNLITRMREQITQGLVQGEGYVSMTKRVKEQFDKDAAGTMRILRTEGGRMQSLGTVESMEHANELGIITMRVWNSAIDGRTRDDHIDMDGKKIKPGELFTLPDGSRAEAPGLSGEASQDINCRCTMTQEIAGYEPEFRRVRGEGVIPQTTFIEWKSERLG